VQQGRLEKSCEGNEREMREGNAAPKKKNEKGTEPTGHSAVKENQRDERKKSRVSGE